MGQRMFCLAHQEAREGAIAAIRAAPDAYIVRLSEPSKSREQGRRYHAMIGDIAAQTEHIGRKWQSDDMKRLLVDEFAEEMRLAGTPLHHDGRVVPSLDGQRIVQLGIQTSSFHVREASQFIEFLFAWGAARGVQWAEPAMRGGTCHG